MQEPVVQQEPFARLDFQIGDRVLRAMSLGIVGLSVLPFLLSSPSRWLPGMT